MVLGGFICIFLTTFFGVDLPETTRKEIHSATIVAGINHTCHGIGEPWKSSDLAFP
jgi:hypothetical protein